MIELVTIERLVGPGREVVLPHAQEGELVLAAIAISEPAAQLDSWYVCNVLVDLYLAGTSSQVRRSIATRAAEQDVLFDEFLLALLGRGEPWMLGVPIERVPVITALHGHELARDALAAFANARVGALEGMSERAQGYDTLMHLLEHCDEVWLLERLMCHGEFLTQQLATRQLLKFRSPTQVLVFIQQHDLAGCRLWPAAVEMMECAELEAVLEVLADHWQMSHEALRAHHAEFAELRIVTR